MFDQVAPEGPGLELALSTTIACTKISVGPMDNNAYLLRPMEGSSAVLIDAANDAVRLLELVGDQPLATIITTHQHRDHWQALRQVATATSARLIGGIPDLSAIEQGAQVADLEGVWDGSRIAIGDEWLEVIGLVGHTPGSITLVYRSANGPAHLFTGDSLFPGGPGKTRSPADFTSLMDDLESKIFAVFGDDTVVHPGHGSDTTLGRERNQLPTWRARGW